MKQFEMIAGIETPTFSNQLQPTVPKTNVLFYCFITFLACLHASSY